MTTDKFTALYADDEGISPRTALALLDAAESIIGGWDREDYLESLPTCVRPAAADGRWYGRYIGAFRSIRDRLAGEGIRFYPGGLAHTTAEELALHHIMREARSAVRDEFDLEFYDAMPARPDDFDFDRARDILLDDQDVLLLFDPSMDGIEDPDDETNRAMGLQPFKADDWFTIFPGHEDRLAELDVLGSLPDLYAYVGDDEHGSGRVGLKQGMVPAGMIPLVVCDFDRQKLERADVQGQMKAQAEQFGKTIRFVRYVPVEVVVELP